MNEKHTIQICEDGATRESGKLELLIGREWFCIDVGKDDTAKSIAKKFNNVLREKYLSIPVVFEAVDAFKF